MDLRLVIFMWRSKIPLVKQFFYKNGDVVCCFRNNTVTK